MKHSLHKHDDECCYRNNDRKDHKGNADYFKYLHYRIDYDFGIAYFFNDDILDIIV